MVDLGYFSPVFVAGRRHGLGIGLLTAGMVVLSACSNGGSAPQTLPRLSTTPAAESSTAPPTSKAAELAAASSVVKQYFKLKNQLASNMSTVPFRKIETADCPCRRFLGSISDVAQSNQHYFGRVLSLHLTPAADSEDLVEVLAGYDTTAGGIAGRDGRVLSRGEARRGVLAMFYVRKTSNGWQIYNIVNLKPGSSG